MGLMPKSPTLGEHNDISCHNSRQHFGAFIAVVVTTIDCIPNVAQILLGFTQKEWRAILRNEPFRCLKIFKDLQFIEDIQEITAKTIPDKRYLRPWVIRFKGLSAVAVVYVALVTLNSF